MKLFYYKNRGENLGNDFRPRCQESWLLSSLLQSMDVGRPVIALVKGRPVNVITARHYSIKNHTDAIAAILQQLVSERSTVRH